MLRAFLTICFCCFILFAQAQFYSANSYPPDYHGTKVQSGKRYSKFLSTAAHYNIPLGSKVLLTERKTGRSVIVVVNDRIEEASSNFIISDAAYEALGLHPGEQIEVKYKILEEGRADTLSNTESTSNQKVAAGKPSLLRIQGVENIQKQQIYLQIGAFSSYASAMNLLQDLGDKNISPLFLIQSHNVYRVLTGIYANETEALASKKKLKENSIPSILKTGLEILNL